MIYQDLADFEGALLYNVMLGTLHPKVTDTEGVTPIVACFDSEPLCDLLKRVRTCGGYATIYSQRDDRVIRVIACIKQESALPATSTDLTEEPRSPDATIGAFIDYLVTQENGIIMRDTLSASPATPTAPVTPAIPTMRIKSYGRPELTAQLTPA